MTKEKINEIFISSIATTAGVILCSSMSISCKKAYKRYKVKKKIQKVVKQAKENVKDLKQESK